MTRGIWGISTISGRTGPHEVDRRAFSAEDADRDDDGREFQL